jgi:hypothetical protein
MCWAAREGWVDIVRMCHDEFKADDVGRAMAYAASEGQEEVVRLCLEWGPKKICWAINSAVANRQNKILRILSEWVKKTNNYEWMNETMLDCRWMER